METTCRLSVGQKEYKSKRKLVQEKLIKFATRIPAFMYPSDTLRHSRYAEMNEALAFLVTR